MIALTEDTMSHYKLHSLVEGGAKRALSWSACGLVRLAKPRRLSLRSTAPMLYLARDSRAYCLA